MDQSASENLHHHRQQHKINGHIEESGAGESNLINSQPSIVVTQSPDNDRMMTQSSTAEDKETGQAASQLSSGGIQIIRIRERHGQFRKALPIMPLPLAIVLCVVNCVLPGIGTLISGFTVFCCAKTEVDVPSRAFWLNVIAAILQIITLPILVGWIWSIIWGVTFITSSMDRNDTKSDTFSQQQQV